MIFIYYWFIQENEASQWKPKQSLSSIHNHQNSRESTEIKEQYDLCKFHYNISWGSVVSMAPCACIQTTFGQVPDQCLWFRSMPSMPSSSRNCHMRLDIDLHQEEPRTHCTLGSEDLNPRPKKSQSTIYQQVEVFENLRRYASPDHHWFIAKSVMLIILQAA